MNTYIFEDQNADHELQRLKLIETAFDGRSKQLIKHCGIGTGMQCLEIGPGAGGMLRWMGRQVGKSGLALGVDKDIKHLSDLRDAPFKILQGNIAELNLNDRFDIVHARYVLIHNKDANEILKKIFALLNPGGYAIIEEPDFDLAMDITGFGESAQNKVNQAICALYEQMGLNPAYGSQLPSQCSNIGFSLDKIEAKAHICNGGSIVAKLMGVSIDVLREKYKSTGVVGDAEIEAYIENSRSEQHWANYYTTVSVVVKKGTSPGHKKTGAHKMNPFPSWQFDEMKQVGKDYADIAEVEAYDAFHSKFRNVEKENEAIIKTLSLQKAHTVIEFGTGTGAFAIQAAACADKVYAVDVSRAMLDYASRKAKKQSLTNILFCHDRGPD